MTKRQKQIAGAVGGAAALGGAAYLGRKTKLVKGVVSRAKGAGSWAKGFFGKAKKVAKKVAKKGRK